ncbi:5-oxoprolinase subunit PxpB [Flagellimonas sp. HMM57]|uniref:5-oxoprolinase subunit PxpB n=1 Tax=unclassified Flagellimonas TaxID=2644544 RepID=UPI0013D120BF|nr:MULTISPECIES: 5-oxoprolinase subunit PxpB [unclassified Flagellimonas]UII75685.1 5-oxoprolinase subunit PxpB [Flagellimonas sp. HMM57]
MNSYPISIKPFGQRAVLVEWPNKVDESILQDILDFTSSFRNLGMPDWEISVAYNSLTMVNNEEQIDFKSIRKIIEECYADKTTHKAQRKKHLWKIPVCYDENFGIDIQEVSKRLNLSIGDLIELHTSYEYVVFGIGFLPGFMYLGGLPKILEIPRRNQPRLDVVKGSVGLAAKQTGIYPQDSPGGWNIIGRCPIPVFNPKAENPCFVNVGDKIMFHEISRAEYDLHKIEGEVGIYAPEKIIIDA